MSWKLQNHLKKKIERGELILVAVYGNSGYQEPVGVELRINHLAHFRRDILKMKDLANQKINLYQCSFSQFSNDILKRKDSENTKQSLVFSRIRKFENKLVAIYLRHFGIDILKNGNIVKRTGYLVPLANQNTIHLAHSSNDFWKGRIQKVFWQIRKFKKSLIAIYLSHFSSRELLNLKENDSTSVMWFLKKGNVLKKETCSCVSERWKFDSRCNLQKNLKTHGRRGDSDLIEVCILHLFLAVEVNLL